MNGHEFAPMPPQDVEAEQDVLGACLLSRRALDEARALLTGSEWYHSSHRVIWDAIVALADADTAVDQITLCDALRRAGRLDEAGGVVYLTQLTCELATAANVTHHARIVVSCHRRRRLIELTQTLERQALDGGDAIETILEQAERQLVDLTGQGDEGAVTLEQVLAEAVAEIEHIQSRPSGIAGIRTGFPDLDRKTGGLQKGDLFLVAARTAMGKSAAGLMFADQAAQDGQRVVIFSTEMRRTKLATRLLAIRSRVPAIRIATGDLGPGDWDALTGAAADLAHLPIRIDHRADVSVPQIAAECARRQRQEGLDLVIVDHIGEIVPPAKATNREQEVSQIAKALKRMARRLDVPVLAMAQLSRAVEARTPPRPELHDLRDSGGLEEAADIVMLLYRPEYYHRETLEYYADGERLELPAAGLAEWIIAKHRSGSTGSVLARWDGALTAFAPYELDVRHEAPPIEFPWEAVSHDNT